MTAVKATAERELKVLKNMSFQKVVVKKEGIENRFEREKFRETKLRDTKEKLRKRKRTPVEKALERGDSVWNLLPEHLQVTAKLVKRKVYNNGVRSMYSVGYSLPNWLHAVWCRNNSGPFPTLMYTLFA